MHALLLSLACATPAAGDWTPLPVPALCRTTAQPNLPPILVSGAHVELSRADPSVARAEGTPALAWNTFLQMIEEDARAHGSSLEVQRFEGGALARGDTASALSLFTELETAGRALDVDLVVTVQRSDGQGAPERYERRVRSGDTVFLGTRESQSFVAGFDVQVAAESGQSEPVLGEVHHGRGLHLTVARVGGGERVYVRGVFDVAELVALDAFDPDTADLGIVQEPQVAWTQAWFSGTTSASRPLVVRACGPGGRAGEWKLEIQARTSSDAGASPNGGAGRYRLFDLAFLCGAGRENLGSDAARPSGAPIPPGPAPRAALPVSAIASLVESARGPAPRGGRSPLYWSDTLLLVPLADEAAGTEARKLVAALERARLEELAADVRLGSFSAALPSTNAAPSRLVSGLERALLAEYRLEIAPQIWMPKPRVETVFDGVGFDLAVNGGRLESEVWKVAIGPVQELTRETAQIGRIQTWSRRPSGARLSVDPGTTVSLALSDRPEDTGVVTSTVR